MVNFLNKLFLKLRGEKINHSNLDLKSEIAQTKRELDALKSFIQGQDFKEAGEYEKAIACFDFALSVENGFADCPEDYERIYFYKGECLQRINQHEAAIENFTKAISLSTNVPYYFFDYRSDSFKAISDLNSRAADLKAATNILKQQKELTEEEKDYLNRTGFEILRVEEYIKLDNNRQNTSRQLKELVEKAKREFPKSQNDNEKK